MRFHFISHIIDGAPLSIMFGGQPASELMSEDPIKRCVLLVLWQSQQDQASELAIGLSAAGEPPIKYKVSGTWHGWKAPGANLASDLIAEVERLAAFAEGPFPREGDIDVTFSDTRLRWKVRRASADAACTLTRVRD